MIRLVSLIGVVVLLAGGACRKSTPSSPADPTPAPAPQPARKPATAAKPAAQPPVVPPKTTYHPYKSSEGRFAAVFPWGAPAVQTRTVPTPHGPVRETLCETISGPKSAAVRVSDWDTPALKGVDLDQMITGGLDAIVRDIGGRVAGDTRMASGMFVVREVTVEAPDRPGQGPIYFRYLIHGRRVYTVGILSDGGTVPEAERNRFFNSIQILN